MQSDEALANVLGKLAGAAELAVDTEFMRRNTYYPQVALLQLCAEDHAYLVDPLMIEELTPLRDLMADPAVVKILHSCSEDLEVFRRWLGVLPTPLIDTQRAAALLGETFGLGYRALVESLVGITLDKGETRSDWLRRPLTESQCHYAAQDVLQLLPAWHCLKERAVAQGRMAWIREEGEAVSAALYERERDLFRRIKGSGRLNERQLEVLRRISEWREERARSIDKPRGWILEDKICLALARVMPGDTPALASIEAMPAAVVRRQGDTLLRLIDEARDVAAEHLPAALPKPLPAEQRAALKELREHAREIAEDLAIAPEAGLSTADLEQLVREAHGERSADRDVAPRWSGWREATFAAPLREKLGEHSV